MLLGAGLMSELAGRIDRLQQRSKIDRESRRVAVELESQRLDVARKNKANEMRVLMPEIASVVDTFRGLGVDVRVLMAEENGHKRVAKGFDYAGK